MWQCCAQLQGMLLSLHIETRSRCKGLRMRGEQVGQLKLHMQPSCPAQGTVWRTQAGTWPPGRCSSRPIAVPGCLAIGCPWVFRSRRSAIEFALSVTGRTPLKPAETVARAPAIPQLCPHTATAIPQELQSNPTENPEQSYTNPTAMASQNGGEPSRGELICK